MSTHALIAFALSAAAAAVFCFMLCVFNERLSRAQLFIVAALLGLSVAVFLCVAPPINR